MHSHETPRVPKYSIVLLLLLCSYSLLDLLLSGPHTCCTHLIVKRSVELDEDDLAQIFFQLQPVRDLLLPPRPPPPTECVFREKQPQKKLGNNSMRGVLVPLAWHSSRCSDAAIQQYMSNTTSKKIPSTQKPSSAENNYPETQEHIRRPGQLNTSNAEYE